MTALTQQPTAAAPEHGVVSPARERELLDRIAQLEADVAQRDEIIEDFNERMDRIRHNLAIERELTDRALRRRFWWW